MHLLHQTLYLAAIYSNIYAPPTASDHVLAHNLSYRYPFCLLLGLHVSANLVLQANGQSMGPSDYGRTLSRTDAAQTAGSYRQFCQYGIRFHHLDLAAGIYLAARNLPASKAHCLFRLHDSHVVSSTSTS